MSDEDRPQGEVPREDHERELPPMAEVVQKTSRFSREAVATMISLATSAFGFVAALAWNSAITAAFAQAFQDDSNAKLSALFIYAVFVTLIGVIVIVLLGRLATRLRTDPIEFKYPGMPK